MMKNGLLFGTFNPLHLSHIELIKKALEHFETLHVFVRCDPTIDLVDWDTKKKWLEKVNEECGGRLVVTKFELSVENKRYDKLDMVGIFKQAQEISGIHIDGLICGEDMQYMVDTLKNSLPDREFVVIPRDGRSSTAVRGDLEKMKDNIPDYVYKDLKERGL